MTNREIFETAKTLQDALTSSERAFELFFNAHKSILSEIDGMYKSYEEARIELNEKYAEKNSDGDFVIENNQYKIPEDLKANFTEELKVLTSDYDEKINQKLDQ